MILVLELGKSFYNNSVEGTLCHMFWNGDNRFEVEYKGETYVVDLKKMTCPCQSWDLK